MNNPFRRRNEVRALSQDQLIDLAMGFRTVGNLFNVTQDNAIKSTAVVACLIVRAETFASLPVHVYRSGAGRRDKVSTHPLDAIMSRAWNPLMTSVEGWRWKQLTEDIRGRAFVRIERRGGAPVAFWPMTNADCAPVYDAESRGVFYDYAGDPMTPKGRYPGADVLHFKGPLVKDAWTGTSLVDQASVAIGLTISSEKFYERLLAKGNHFPGHLETDASLTKDDILALAENMAALSGLDHTGETRIFDRGLKYVQNSMSVVDADLTAQQTWYLQEVCRVFRIPPPLVQDWSRSTYTNSESADLWFAKHTILPIAVNTERVIERIFVNRNETDHFVKFELDGLLRGDFKSRMEGYGVGIDKGFMLRAEARQLEDMNPIPGLDKPLVALNMATIDDDGAIEIPPKPSPSPSSPAAVDTEPITEDARSRIITRAAQDAERGRDPQTTRDFARKVIEPLVAAGILTDPDSFIEEVLA